MKIRLVFGLALAFLVSCKTVTPLSKGKKETDNQIMQRLVLAQKYEACFSEDTTLSEAKIDSILSEEFTTVETGDVVYDSDSTIKVFNVLTEYCGAYCNYVYEKHVFDAENKNCLLYTSPSPRDA